MNRRDFFQLFIGSAGFLTVATILKPHQLNAQQRRRSGGTAAASGPVLVDPASADAMQVSYVHKHSDMKKKELQTERSGVKWLDQKCTNCNFYQERKKDNKVGSIAVGGCGMPFAAGKVVANDGWCITWAKK